MDSLSARADASWSHSAVKPGAPINPHGGGSAHEVGILAEYGKFRPGARRAAFRLEKRAHPGRAASFNPQNAGSSIDSALNAEDT